MRAIVFLVTTLHASFMVGSASGNWRWGVATFSAMVGTWAAIISAVEITRRDAREEDRARGSK